MATNRAPQVATVAAFTLTIGFAFALAGCSSAASGSGGGVAAKGSSAPTAATKPAVAAPAHGKLDGVPKACPSADDVMSNLNLSTLVVDAPDPSLCQYLFKGDVPLAEAMSR
jgi:hypothetical protein